MCAFKTPSYFCSFKVIYHGFGPFLPQKIPGYPKSTRGTGKVHTESDTQRDTESERLNAEGDISDSAEEVEVVVESQNTRPKKPKQSQITDFFRTDK